MEKTELKPNQVQCPHCKQVIESKHNYDFQVCKCGRTGIDGGNMPRIIEFPEDNQEGEKT
jgi:Zn finger protein HypA/HybF involved in hydrogenase expression